MSQSYEFANPQHVTVGTVGPQGQRAFYLQVRESSTLLTMKVEKQQVAALSAHLGQLLQDLPRPGELPSDDELALEDFDDEAFVIGSIAVAYDIATDRVVIVAEEIVAEDEPQGDEVRVSLTREQAGALAITGTRLVEAGRPPCPLCGYPLDPRGHACPRTNGHHAPLR